MCNKLKGTRGGTRVLELLEYLRRVFMFDFSGHYLSTVGQDIFADMIFSRISRILTKPRTFHVRKYDFNDLFTKKAY